MGVSTIMRVFDIVFGLIGMVLILRIVLQLFKVSYQNPIMRALEAVTDPIVSVVNRILGIPAYRRHDLSTIAVLAASVIVIWVVRTLIVWLFQLILFVPGWVLSPLSSVWCSHRSGARSPHSGVWISRH